MKFQSILLLSLVFICISNAGAQTQKREILPTSPEAAALTKMVSYPVNMNTGVPDISIPLYNIESGDLKLPLSLNYHSGGFKINEQSTRLGLGWSLSTDIQITRTVNGLDDFDSDIGYIANTKMRTYYEDGRCTDCVYPFSTPFASEALAKGDIDGAPDKFYYKLLNKSGSFYFIKGNTGATSFIIPVPYDNINIQYVNNRFIIIDTDGTTYYFGAGGIFNPNDLPGQGLELSGLKGIGGNWSDPTVSHITTWKCKQIVNASKTESLNFSYVSKPDMVFTRNSEKIEYYNNSDPCTLGPVGNLNNQSQTSNTTTYDGLLNYYPFQYLSSPKYMVTYPEGAMFHLPYLSYPGSGYQVNDRAYTTSSPRVPAAIPTTVSGLALDNITFRGGHVSFNGSDQMYSIFVYNDVSSQTMRVIELKNNYTVADVMDYPKRANGANFKGTLYLDSINIKVNGVSYEKYGFLYKQKTCFGNHMRGSDAWGYPNASTVSSNGGVESSSMVPFASITQRFYNYVGLGVCNDYTDNVIFNIGNIINIETPNEEAMKRGILERIIYPSGGYADFDFEPNMYQEFASESYGSYGSAPILLRAGGLRIRSINYYDGKNSRVQSQKYYRYGELEDGVGILTNPPPRIWVGNSKNYAAFSYSQNIVYLKNSNTTPCYEKGCLGAWTREVKTTYQPASALDYNYTNGAPIFYTKVTEYNSDLGELSGKKVYTYYPPWYYDPSSGYRQAMVYGTNIPVMYADGLIGPQKSIAEYNYDKSTNAFQLIHSKENAYISYKRPEQTRVAYGYLNNIYQISSGNVPSPIDFYDQTSGWAAGSIPLGSDITVGNYGIFSGKLFLTSETEKWQTPTGIRSQLTQYTYKNLDGGSNLPYVQPSTIKTTNTKGEQYTKTITYPYDYPGVSVYDQMKAANMVSIPVSETTVNNTLGKEISKTQTNFGLVTVTPSSGAPVSFILPVSLQSSRQGNTLETDMSYLYNEKARIREVTDKLGMVKTYLWGYNYIYPVAEFSGLKYTDISPAINESSLQTLVDESQLKTTLTNLRNQFPGAMVSTFTYKPLVGISIQTAANGLDKFFDYDAYGRLLTIKDRNKNILNRYEYHYKPVDLTAPNLAGQSYTNTPMMATFKQNCPTAPSIKVYNYIIPGGVSQTISTKQANLNMESSLFYGGPNASTTADCIDASQVSVLSLHTTMVPQLAVPSDLYLDLLQDNGITGSYKFPYSLAIAGNPYVPPTQLYTRSGSYKLSFRQPAFESGSIIKFYVTPSNGSAGFWIKNGDTVTFTAGVNYAIDATNN